MRGREDPADVRLRSARASITCVDARETYFEQVLKFLIMANVRRGQPLLRCAVGRGTLRAGPDDRAHGQRLGTHTIAHGCTAAGNDQVRFEVALRTIAPELEILAPSRQGVQAAEQLKYLEEHKAADSALWRRLLRGIGLVAYDRRQETLSSLDSIPDEAWVLSRTASAIRARRNRHVIGFERGVPARSMARRLGAVEIIERLETIGANFGIGRGIHLGDTIIGTKGRVAFEAPAAEMLLNSHRELEKLVLTSRQSRVQGNARGPYGDLVHEGQLLDPVCRDMEALFVSSQARVSGDVKLVLRPGSAFVEGLSSPYSAHGRLEGRLWRIGRRMDADRCPWILEDARAPGNLLHASR